MIPIVVEIGKAIENRGMALNLATHQISIYCGLYSIVLFMLPIEGLGMLCITHYFLQDEFMATQDEYKDLVETMQANSQARTGQKQ